MTYTFPRIESAPGITITVGFKTEKCQGEIVKVTSKSDQFFILVLEGNKLVLKFKSSLGDGSIELVGQGSFCDNERHTVAISRMNRRVRYKVDSGDWKSEERARLENPFADMYKIIVGSSGNKGFRGCITGAKVGKRMFEEKRDTIQPIEAYLYYDEEGTKDEVKAQKKDIEVSGITGNSKEKCGPEPQDIPPIPTPRVPGPGTQEPVKATTDPDDDDDDEGSNTAIIVIVVLILILVIVAVLVAIYWYWSRHKGVYHTHEDDENLKGTDPYIDLATTKKGEESQKKKEWYI